MSDQTANNVEYALVGAVQYSRWTLNGMSRDDVKKLALAAHTERNSTVNRGFLGSAATKGELIDFILGKPVDDSTRMVEPVKVAQANSGDLAQTLASAIAGFLPKPDASVSREQVEAIVNERLEAAKAELAGLPKTIRIEVKERPAIEVKGIRHENFDDLLQDALAFQACGEISKANFCLTGEAGTGKTTAVKKIAEALELPFYFNGAIDSEYKLRGFIDASGKIVYTPFRQCYTTGGVYLYDELDGSMPSATLAFNAALSNGCYDFPDPNGIVPTPRHDACFVFAATNTWGGPEGQYVGRMRQDGAFLDRFMRVPWNTDEKFERALCSDKSWCDYVQGVRAKVHANGIQHIVSPRATLNGAILLDAGRPWQRVVDICVRKGLNQEDWNKVRGEAL